MKKIITCFAIAIFALSQYVLADVPSSKSARVYIIEPANGATVSSPFSVKFGLKGMGVAPAGVDRANTGHHHLLIDASGLPDMSKPMGADVIHFGGGQTETELNLPPGKHTLQLILGNMYHIPIQPPVVSEIVTVIVK